MKEELIYLLEEIEQNEFMSKIDKVLHNSTLN